MRRVNNRSVRVVLRYLQRPYNSKRKAHALANENACAETHRSQRSRKELAHTTWKKNLDGLRQGRIEPNINLYVSILRGCGNAKAVLEGKEIHANLIRNGYAHDTFIGNLILQMYGKCEALEEAKKVFDRISLPNIFSWSLIVLAFSNWRRLDDALNIFKQMPERDEVCWTSMITAFARHDRGEEAIQLFHQMQLHGIISDKVTFISMLDACASCQLLSQGKLAHCQVIQMDLALDIVVATALVNMYGKCCSMEDALAVFYTASRLDHILWTAVIAGCALNGHVKKAIHLFRQMQLENMALDNVTLGCILNECNGHLALSIGKWMHAHIILSGFGFNVDLGSSVISMYGSCGTAADACNAFEKLPFQDLGSWNSMIAAYALHGHDVEAHKLFQQMQHEGSMPDGITFVSILNASLSQTAVTQGKQVHAQIIASGLHKDVVVGTAILNMYGKCGGLEDAERAFYNLPKRNIISWNAMILVYAQNGHAENASQAYEQMCQEGFLPNDVTFIQIQYACSHAGFVNEGWHWFVSIRPSHGSLLEVENYNCTIDLLGRMGYLDEAEDMISNMPLFPDMTSWVTLLGACRRLNDVERGRRAAAHAIALGFASYSMMQSIPF